MKKLLSLLCAGSLALSSLANDVIKLGIIGLDTSHSTAFTELLNGDDMSDPYVRDFEIVAAYPYGSTTIESSYNRI
ncbi:MAG: gfo/Idh/MocA family oxidoreductase, partial [Muribaculaceae bacterium]|nr:gfo/Idh/MocA family oxidoreductase [Muribaculaceae bacterium]